MKITKFTNINLEQEALALILQSESYYDILGLDPEDFYDNINQEIYKNMADLRDKGDKINIVNLGAEMSSSQSIVPLLGKLSDQYITGDSAGKITSTLKRFTIAREVLAKLSKSKDASVVDDLVGYLSKAEPKIYQTDIATKQDLLTRYEEVLAKRLRRKQTDGGIGLITGFRKIDEKIRFKPGDLITLAAPSSVGKSSLALSIAINAAMYQQNVQFYSAEMTWDSIMDRAAAILTRRPAGSFETNINEEASQKAIRELKELVGHFALGDGSALTSTKVSAAAKKHSVRDKPDLIVVDYIQYLADTAPRQNDSLRIAGITRRLKNLAVELDCVVLALSQFNREADKAEAPGLHHLKGSSSIEQDSDMVLFLHREDRSSRTGTLYVAKNRRGEVNIGFDIYFSPELTMFSEQPIITDTVAMAIQEFQDLI